MAQDNLPYKKLGSRLRQLRLLRKVSTLELSGAIEVDELDLVDIESGQKRPTEDILSLLISYFEVKDEEAFNFWQLAGYEPPKDHDIDADHEFSEDGRQEMIEKALRSGNATVMMMALDPRVVYSDGVDVVANRQGVVLSFTQPSPTGNGRMPVARIGVSYDQAQAILQVLNQTLAQAKLIHGPKQLPQSSKDDKSPGAIPPENK